MKKLSISAVLLGFAGLAFAEPPPQFEARACYGRIYSPEHMKAHPEQNVAAIFARLKTDEDDLEATYISMTSVAAYSETEKTEDEEAVAGVSYEHSPYCYWFEGDEVHEEMLEFNEWLFEGVALCGIDCDGGQMAILSLDDRKVTFKVNYLMADSSSRSTDDDGCHAGFALGDRGAEFTTYTLYRMDDAACE